jgi:YD repeat-containing protein
MPRNTREGRGQAKLSYKPILFATLFIVVLFYTAPLTHAAISPHSISYNAQFLPPTTRTYTVLDRLTKTIFPDATESAIGYDLTGKKTNETDQEGKTTRFEHDGSGNLTKVIDPRLKETAYGYDENNNRTRQTDANLHTTAMGYDKLNRLILRTYPNGDHEHFDYDANGNIFSKIAGNGEETTYRFDSRGGEGDVHKIIK